MWTTAGFNGANAFGFERFVRGQKFAVFLRKNVIRDGGDIARFAKAFAQLQHQSCFSAADGPANAHGEGALIEIAIERAFAVVEMAGMFGV